MATGSAPAPPRGPGRVPASASSFRGRAHEVAAVVEALGAGRLVTLTGPGGVGKTRVALAAVGAAAERFGRPVFVDLTRIGEGSPVSLAVAESLGLRDLTDESARSAILWWLEAGGAPGEVLFVVDNAEHVLQDAASLVALLLAGSEGCRILVTSRQPLRVAGERVLAVGPLPVDDAEALFWDRALALRPSLGDTREAREASRALCARLDGLPLAVEHAAARATVLTPQELLPRLDRRLAALGTGPTTAPARHRTLRACIAGSADALGAQERAVFEACAVFASPFDAEAAAAVAGATLDHLEELVLRSLLQTGEDARGRTTFRLLESLREFAREGLESSGTLEGAQRRHLAWLGSVFGAGTFPSVLEASRAGEHSDLLPDLRAALDFAVRAAPAEGLRLMAATRELWFRNGQDEGLGWALRLLERHPARDEARAAGLVVSANLRTVRQETELAGAHVEEALALLDPRSAAAAEALFYRAVSRALGHDPEGADRAAVAAMEAYTSLGDAAGRSRALCARGMAAVWGHREQDALEILEAAYPLAVEAGDAFAQGIALTYGGLAESTLGRSAEARDRLFRAVEVLAGIRDVTMRAIALARLAALTVRRDPTTAARAAAAVSRREGAGGRFHEISSADLDQVRATAELLLGPGGLAAAWGAGEKLRFADAAEELRAVWEAHDAESPAALTARELEVAQLVRRGLGNAAIAEQLTLSARTVENHVAHALAKLGLRSRSALAVWAAERSAERASSARQR
ncbi:ATP-binding protein [Sinomonas flava]|uniref:ATP-binding protein n=1 Tax=Sinomonas flava TaxID=496857 RepID=UPI0039A4CD05